MTTVTIDGRLAAEPDARRGDNWTKCALRVASKRSFRKGNGEEKELTDYLDVVTWGKVAEGAARLRKGDRVVILGHLEVESWEDRETGKKRSKVIVKAGTVATPLLAGSSATSGGSFPDAPGESPGESPDLGGEPPPF